MSLSGDRALVGAYREDAGEADAGSAYIFRRVGYVWVQEYKLLSGDKQLSGYFGRSVSLSGDRALVGAYREDAGEDNAGSAYIFRREGSTWVPEYKLQADDKQAGDYFGYSVSLSGDRALVGAYLEDTGEAHAGSAYIFRREGNTWAQEHKLQADDKQTSDYFGISVSLSDDHALVGAHLEDTGGTSAGSAYLFSLVGPVLL